MTIFVERLPSKILKEIAGVDLKNIKEWFHQINRVVNMSV